MSRCRRAFGNGLAFFPDPDPRSEISPVNLFLGSGTWNSDDSLSIAPKHSSHRPISSGEAPASNPINPRWCSRPIIETPLRSLPASVRRCADWIATGEDSIDDVATVEPPLEPPLEPPMPPFTIRIGPPPGMNSAPAGKALSDELVTVEPASARLVNRVCPPPEPTSMPCTDGPPDELVVVAPALSPPPPPRTHYSPFSPAGYTRHRCAALDDRGCRKSADR